MRLVAHWVRIRRGGECYFLQSRAGRRWVGFLVRFGNPTILMRQLLLMWNRGRRAVDVTNAM